MPPSDQIPPNIETLRFAVPGLEKPAEILVDQWGIPHLRAQSRRDVFCLQGFNAARDRLWQLDLGRKRGLGLLAADFGPGFLAQDRAARLFLYRGDMAAEWAAYGTPEAEAIAEAFVAGINAFIGLTEAEPKLLPPEFALMGTRPQRWAASDVVRIRSHALVSNAESELARAQVLARGEIAKDLLRARLEPDWKVQVPEGLDLEHVPADVLDVIGLAGARVSFSPERLAASLDEAWRWTKLTDLGEVARSAGVEGSNNWAISPGRTATGRPILASDPHRQHSAPALRYLVHLTAPGLDTIGAGEPCLPGVSIGHNGTAAFGLTIFPIDQEDVYVYELNPKNPDQYRYGNGLEAMRILSERISVKGAPDQEVALHFTRHGPVVHIDQARNRAFALRSVWFEPGTSPYFGSLAYLDARTPQDFAKAMRHWGTPPVNHVYADSGGNIAWMTAGKAPRRPNWDGLLPVPGNGTYEWDGFHAPENLPREINPARGFVATANEMNLPKGYPYAERKLSFEWSERSRATRIMEALADSRSHGLADSMALQCDVVSIPARRLMPLLAGLGRSDESIAPALDLLRNWDCRLGPESPAAALFEVYWTKHLKPALLERLAGDTALLKLLAPGDNETLLAILEHPGAEPRLGTELARDAILARALAAGMAECQSLLGPDPGRWAWGRLHHGYFEHAVSAVAPERKAVLDVGPLPIGGSGSTPMNTTYRLPDFRVTSGASFRMVLDVGAWDNSRAINAPGQSGLPASPHYRDLSGLWAKGEYFPLLYTRDAVAKAARLRIILGPADDRGVRPKA